MDRSTHRLLDTLTHSWAQFMVEARPDFDRAFAILDTEGPAAFEEAVLALVFTDVGGHSLDLCPFEGIAPLGDIANPISDPTELGSLLLAVTE